MRLLGLVLLAAIVPGCGAKATDVVADASLTTRQRLARAATGLEHFATGDLVSNHWGDVRRWPVGRFEIQFRLFQRLRQVVHDRDGLRGLLGDPDPKIRTLALGALFIREDPQDLPFIARLLSDNTPTIRRIGSSLTSQPGPLPLEYFESLQSVGTVAQEMIRFYLRATNRRAFTGLLILPEAPDADSLAVTRKLFDAYWSERDTHARCVSWFLVKMKRSTRGVSPLQAGYESDVRRVLNQIDALPPIERAWTLLFVRTDQTQLREVVPDAMLVEALKVIGPDSLMSFLRREHPTDDPDLEAGSVYPGSRTGFILDHAQELLRSGDADAVLAAAEAYRTLDNNTEFVAAASRLKALEDPERVAASLKADIQRITLAEILGARDQAVLTLTLWQIRGATERTFLVNWLYGVLPNQRAWSELDTFIRNVGQEARPDTPLLLSAIVNDPRFDQMGWSPMADILMLVNQSLAQPLVEQRTIYDNRSNDGRANHEQVLASWRRLLREYFSVSP